MQGVCFLGPAELTFSVACHFSTFLSVVKTLLLFSDTFICQFISPITSYCQKINPLSVKIHVLAPFQGSFVNRGIYTVAFPLSEVLSWRTFFTGHCQVPPSPKKKTHPPSYQKSFQYLFSRQCTSRNIFSTAETYVCVSWYSRGENHQAPKQASQEMGSYRPQHHKATGGSSSCLSIEEYDSPYAQIPAHHVP